MSHVAALGPLVAAGPSGALPRAARQSRLSRARSVPRTFVVATSSSARIVCGDGKNEGCDGDGAGMSRRLALGSGAALVGLISGRHAAWAGAEPLKASFYDYTVKQYGKDFDLGAFKGDVTVVLNVASE